MAPRVSSPVLPRPRASRDSTDVPGIVPGKHVISIAKASTPHASSDVVPPDGGGRATERRILKVPRRSALSGRHLVWFLSAGRVHSTRCESRHWVSAAKRQASNLTLDLLVPSSQKVAEQQQHIDVCVCHIGCFGMWFNACVYRSSHIAGVNVFCCVFKCACVQRKHQELTRSYCVNVFSACRTASKTGSILVTSWTFWQNKRGCKKSGAERFRKHVEMWEKSIEIRTEVVWKKSPKQ